ncbi:MAG: hypothetical protein ABIE70_06510 [bacterium]
MAELDHNAVTQIERELIFALKEEYSFYQSLYLTLDKQRDSIRFNKDERLLDLFTEIERCHQRIKRSEEKIAQLKARDPKLFKLASAHPEVRKLVNSIATMVKKNVSLVAECEEYLQGRYKRIKEELGELQNSRKILQYMQQSDPSPQFVDGKS